MPRKSSKKSQIPHEEHPTPYKIKPHRDCEWGGFVRIPISEDSKIAFDLWYKNHVDEVDHLLSGVVFEGMKFSLTYDGDNSCFIATFTGTAYRGTAHLMTTSARAGSWLEATALLLFKHLELTDGFWNTYADGKKSSSWG